MSGPRNLCAYRRGQALRAEIRSILETHPPLLAPLTPRAIRARLIRSPRPSERTIRWHIYAIRLEAERAELGSEIGCHS